MRYIIHSTIKKIICIPARETITESWFILTDGSHEALYVGDEKPDLNEGGRIRIILEKTDV